VRDEQVRRYARHILLPDLGGLGQTALLVSTARIQIKQADDVDAMLVAAKYLAAGGVGTVVIDGATDAQLAGLAAYGPDCKLVTAATYAAELDVPAGKPLRLEPLPAWWPAADGDATARAFWRGATATTSWMADIANR